MPDGQFRMPPKLPEARKFVMFKVADPVLLIVMVCGRLVVPTLTRPKSAKFPIMEEMGEKPVIS